MVCTNEMSSQIPPFLFPSSLYPRCLIYGDPTQKREKKLCTIFFSTSSLPLPKPATATSCGMGEERVLYVCICLHAFFSFLRLIFTFFFPFLAFGVFSQRQSFLLPFLLPSPCFQLPFTPPPPPLFFWSMYIPNLESDISRKIYGNSKGSKGDWRGPAEPDKTSNVRLHCASNKYSHGS